VYKYFTLCTAFIIKANIHALEKVSHPNALASIFTISIAIASFSR